MAFALLHARRLPAKMCCATVCLVGAWGALGELRELLWASGGILAHLGGISAVLASQLGGAELTQGMPLWRQGCSDVRPGLQVPIQTAIEF